MAFLASDRMIWLMTAWTRREPRLERWKSGTWGRKYRRLQLKDFEGTAHLCKR
jgi:hypothetical protein